VNSHVQMENKILKVWLRSRADPGQMETPAVRSSRVERGIHAGARIEGCGEGVSPSPRDRTRQPVTATVV